MAINFIETQLKTSERLFKAMQEDHNQRTKNNQYLYETVDSLIKKINERDATIIQLRNRLNAILNILEEA